MKRLASIPPLALLLALIFSPALAEARSGGRITGKVVDPEGRVLIGAVVTIFKEDHNGGTILYTRTDRRGDYTFPQVMEGNYSLHVNYDGYRPLVKPNLAVGQGKTTTLNVILLDLLQFVSSDDPRNWGVSTVLRSTSDRRLIFRATDDAGTNSVEIEPRFERNGAVALSSSTGLSGQGYSSYPNSGAGIVSNFAYSEPVSRSSRMILSGQLSAGTDSLWRVRNTFQYRPQPGRDMRFTLGYGRQSLTGVSLGAMAGPAQFFAIDPSIRDSGVETLSMGFAASDQMLDTVLIEYGFDLSNVRQGTSRSVFSPFYQLDFTPLPGWSFKTAMASRRLSDANSIYLPDGEFINMMEPVYISNIDGELRVSQFKHFEIGVERSFGSETALDLSLYEDRMDGPGIPLPMTMTTGGVQESRLGELAGGLTRQRGARLSLNRRISESMTGRVRYVYARGVGLDAPTEFLPGGTMADDLSPFVRGAYFHSLMGSVNAKVARTQTDLTAIVRWDAGNPATPVDLFADPTDTQGTGVAFCIQQLIPLPNFLYAAGRWIALVDVRNLFEQGKYVIPMTDGLIIVAPNPRYVRFGLNLKFN